MYTRIWNIYENTHDVMPYTQTRTLIIGTEHMYISIHVHMKYKIHEHNNVYIYLLYLFLSACNSLLSRYQINS